MLWRIVHKYRSVLSFLLIFLVWEACVEFGLVKAFFVSKPSSIFLDLVQRIKTGEIIHNTWVTLYEFLAGLLLAVLLGCLCAIVASRSVSIERVLHPFVWFTYSSPTIAFYPLFVAWLGLGAPTIIAIAFLFSITPIYVNMLVGLKSVDRDLLKALICFGATPRDLFLKLALPNSIPLALAGLRLAIGRALTGVIAAELFGATTAGLGYSIAYYGQKLQTTAMMTSLVVVVALGVVLTQTVVVLENYTDRWRT